MSSALKLVESELPPSRVNLARAIEARKAAMEKVQAIGAVGDRLRGLINDEAVARTALAGLEQQSAASALTWANGGEWNLPPTDEMSAAENDVAVRKRLADAARAAQGEVMRNSQAASAELSEATGSIVDMVRTVMLEVALDLCAKRLALLKQATQLDAELIALGEVWKSARHGEPPQTAFLNYIEQMRKWLLEKPPEASATPAMRQHYVELAGRLMSDAGQRVTL